MVVIIMLLFVLFFVFSFASFAAVCFARNSLRHVSSTQLYSGFGKKMSEFPVKVLHPTHSLTYTISDTHSVTYSLIYVIYLFIECSQSNRSMWLLQRTGLSQVNHYR